MRRIPVTAALLVPLAVGCATRSEPSGEGAAPGSGLTSVPADAGTRTRVDFGGAVELLGWDMSSEKAEPGSSLHLRSYFRVLRALPPGYRVSTQLVPMGTVEQPEGKDGDANEPDAGEEEPARPEPLEKPWPDRARLGSIVVDERDIAVPKDLTAPSVALVMCLVHDAVQVEGAEVEGLASLSLPILSGLTAGEGRALLARLETGANSGEKRAEQGRKRLDRRPRPAGARPPHPALSALRRAFPMHPPIDPKENQ